jgi:membrane-bound ClpP family serine protease
MTLTLFGRQQKPFILPSNPHFLLDLSQLKVDEVIEVRCDPTLGITNIRKLEGMAGRCFATAKTSFEPGSIGKVSWNSSLWSALCCGDQKIISGQTVLIQAKEGLTLYVRPLADPARSLAA